MAVPGFMRNMRKASSHSLNNLYVTLSGEFNGKILILLPVMPYESIVNSLVRGTKQTPK